MRSIGVAITIGLAVSLAAAGCGDNIHPKVAISGKVTGLAGTGLVLRDNGTDQLTIASNGAFTFATELAPGASYAVTVATQPTSPAQFCTVVNGTGTVQNGQPVTDVEVNCAISQFTVGGTVVGLTGSGLTLEDNGGDDLAISANGAFTFATPLASGATFAVTISAQPAGPTQTCTVSGGTGTIVAGNVTSVVVNCSVDAFTIGGTISGLAATAVLQDNGGDNLPVTANGTFAFATPLPSGQMYSVTVLTQPSGPTQLCTVAPGTGSGTVAGQNITTVVISCATTPFSITVTVAGLAGSGLDLQDNGSDDLAVGSNGTYTFATDVLSGSGYDVTVFTQPIDPYQACNVTNGSGTVGSADVNGILVNCATDTFAIDVQITGLAGTIDLQDNGSDDLIETTDGTYAFATPISSGAGYAVTIASHTGVSQDCEFGSAGSAGTIEDAPATVTLTCSTISYTIGGTLSGLAAGESLTLEDNGADDLTLGSNGGFTFATAVPSGQPYSVAVTTAPGSPIAETCLVASGSGTVGFAPVTDVDVSCAPTPFAIDVTVNGLGSGTTLVLQDNGGDNLTVTASGATAFATPVVSGDTYDVTILSEPTGQVCSVVGASGTVGASSPQVVVNCTTSCFTFTNTAGVDLTGNDWFDACATTTGTQLVIDLVDGSGNDVYHATGAIDGTWTENNLTSTDTTETSTGGIPPGYYTNDFDIGDHDRKITLDNGDMLTIAGRFSSNDYCHGSLGDGYVIVIYAAEPNTPDDSNNIRMVVTTYAQQNLYAGTARGLDGWSQGTEISYDNGALMDTCGQSGQPGMTEFDGTFTFAVLP